jgi:hypothetical protein
MRPELTPAFLFMLPCLDHGAARHVRGLVRNLELRDVHHDPLEPQ